MGARNVSYFVCRCYVESSQLIRYRVTHLEGAIKRGSSRKPVLTDWQTGTHLASNFTCNAARPIYRKHLAMLKKIKREKGAGYYTMLCELYTRAA